MHNRAKNIRHKINIKGVNALSYNPEQITTSLTEEEEIIISENELDPRITGRDVDENEVVESIIVEQPAKKNNTLLYIGIAAGVLFFLTKKKK